MRRIVVIPMIRLPLVALFVLHSVIAQGRLRKISGEAAPEKAQEIVEYELDDSIPTIDSSVQLDNNIPEPPSLPLGLPIIQKNPRTPTTSSSFPVAPIFTEAAPPSIKPTIHSTQTTTVPYDEDPVTADINDILPETLEDLEEFQKADLLENEEDDDVKDLVKKSTVIMADDYYITSPATTWMSKLQEDAKREIEEEEEEIEDVPDIGKLLDDRMTDKNGGMIDMRNELLSATQSTIDQSTMPTPSLTRTITVTSRTKPSASAPTTNAEHKKTCIHVNELHMVDDSVVSQVGVKKGTVEVSVELEEEQDNAEDHGNSSANEETESPARQSREHKAPVIWKKFIMDCDEEIDDKGEICKLWAAGGLCATHKPTMFLFCRKTCLCVGPN